MIFTWLPRKADIRAKKFTFKGNMSFPEIIKFNFEGIWFPRKQAKGAAHDV